MKRSFDALMMGFIFFLTFPAAWSQDHDFGFEHFQLTPAGEQNLVVLDWELGRDLSEESPLYKTILDHFKKHAQTLGERQAGEVLNRRNGFSLLGLNNVGFSHSEDFGHFFVNAKRLLSPDLFHDERWIVTDEFHLTIEATQLLGKLREDGIIDIAEKQLLAFAGIQFKRVYRYVHFADNYEKALTSPYHNLFLSFSRFRGTSFMNLEQGQLITREDFMSFEAGALGNLPISIPGSVSAGILARYKKVAKVEVHLPEEREKTYPDEWLRFNYEHERSSEINAHISLQADFLKLLRITLLSFDFNYRYTQSDKVYLSFQKNDRERLRTDHELKSELLSLLRARKKPIQRLRPYVVSSEQRRKEISESRYLLLLYGGLRERETEHVQIQKDGVLSTFFMHRFEQVKFVQNFWSRVTSIVLKSLLNLKSIVAFRLRDARSVDFEYQAKRNVVALKERLNIEKDDRLSLNFDIDFFAQKLRGKERQKVADYVAHYTNSNPLISQMIEHKKLNAPVRFINRIQVNKEAITNFLSFKYHKVQAQIVSMCDPKRWLSRIFCKFKLQKSYDRFYTEWTENPTRGPQVRECEKWVKKRRYNGARKRRVFIRHCLRWKNLRSVQGQKNDLPLWRFKDFLQAYYLQVGSRVDLMDLFSISKLFSYGRIEAVDSAGLPFIHHFNEGEYKGLGVVQRAQEQIGQRGPASVIIEE